VGVFIWKVYNMIPIPFWLVSEAEANLCAVQHGFSSWSFLLESWDGGVGVFLLGSLGMIPPYLLF
jgi:hypothetical protein